MIDAWLDSVESAAVRGGIALSLAWAFGAIPRVPAAVRCWAWRAAFGVVIASFFWTTPVDVPVLQSRGVSPRSDAGPIEISTTAEDYGPTRPGSVVMNSVPTNKPTWPSIAFASWIAFVGIYAIGLVASARAARRLREGDSVEVPNLDELCRSVGVRRPSVVVRPNAAGPLLVGLFRPVVVLPSSTILPAILAHELAHLRRRDLLWNWLPVIAFVLLPWHPLVWIGRRHWRLSTESACDAEALVATSVPARDYARELVGLATSGRPVPVGAIAVVSCSKWMLKRRLLTMTNVNQWTWRRLVPTGCVIVAMTAMVVTPWRVVAQQPPATRPAGPTTSQFITVTVSGHDKVMSLSVPDNATLTLVSPGPVTMTTTTEPVAVDQGLSEAFSAAGGQIYAPTADLIADGPGPVKAVNVHEGQAVKAGDVLIQLDDMETQAKLNYALASVQQTEAKLARLKKQAQSGVAGVGEVEDAKLAVELAQSQLLLARAESDRTRIVAPFDGVIGPLELQPGQRIGDRKVSTITQVSAVKASFSVRPVVGAQLKPGMTVDLYREGEGRTSARGQISFVPPTTDGATGMMTVKVKLAPGTAGLIPGMGVLVKLPATK